MRRVIGIGETILDIIFRNDVPVSAVPGGSTFNAMISLGRTAVRDFRDVSIHMVTETGTDHVGDIVTSFMESNGVSGDLVTRNDGSQTNISLAFLDADNNAHYQFYKERSKISASQSFTENDIVLLGSYFAINPEIRQEVAGLLRDAATAGAILYYDINFRRNYLSNINETFGNIEENCRLSDFVRGSAEDFEYLFGTGNPDEVYEKHISPLCPNFICTCGAEPVRIYTERFRFSIPVPDVKTVSTIGAGDSFNAGFIHSLLKFGVFKKDIPEIKEDTIKIAAENACRFSAEVCCRPDNYVGRDFVL